MNTGIYSLDSHFEIASLPTNSIEYTLYKIKCKHIEEFLWPFFLDHNFVAFFWLNALFSKSEFVLSLFFVLIEWICIYWCYGRVIQCMPHIIISSASDWNKRSKIDIPRKNVHEFKLQKFKFIYFWKIICDKRLFFLNKYIQWNVWESVRGRDSFGMPTKFGLKNKTNVRSN